MSENFHRGLPFFFLAGSTKCATTWLWKCLMEHPEICIPEKLDRINFFSLHYQKGFEWYSRFFDVKEGQKVIIDPTPEYQKAPFAPERIFKFRPDARFVFVVRNPIDRAFSLWWHQKRKKRINYDFSDLFERKGIGSYALYDEWVVSGFYLYWIEAYLKHFPKEQIKIMLYDDLQKDPESYIQEVYQFLGVNDQFSPSMVHEVVNSGSPLQRQDSPISRFKKRLNPSITYPVLKDELRVELQQIFEPHNLMLGEYLGRDLSHWK